MRTIPDDFVIPDFGDRPAPAPVDGATTAAAAVGAPVGYGGPRKLALICSKGNLDMAYPGLILGNSAAGEGVETHIFFTFWGLDIINTKTNDSLQFTMIGNTAMHMNELGWLKRGWEHKSMPQWMGGLPGMTGVATKMMHKQLEELDIPAIPEFLDLLQAAGVHMWACRLSFDMMKIIEADLHPGVDGVISAGDFIEISEGAQTLFI
jgi:peroxiredoxin family protein